MTTYTSEHPLHAMTYDKWRSLNEAVRVTLRDNSNLTSDLIGYEGHRVEVLGEAGATPRRFWVGKSTGWRPCHLEVHNSRSMGGSPAAKSYFAVRVVRYGPR